MSDAVRRFARNALIVTMLAPIFGCAHDTQTASEHRAWKQTCDQRHYLVPRDINAASILVSLAANLTAAAIESTVICPSSVAYTPVKTWTAEDEAARKVACLLPGMRAADGAPAAQPARVRLEAQTILVNGAWRMEPDGSGKPAFQKARQPARGDFWEGDVCGTVETTIIGHDLPREAGWRLRPDSELGVGGEAPEDETPGDERGEAIRQRNQDILRVLSGGDYVVVPGVDLTEAAAYARRLRADGYAPAGGQLFLQAGYAFIPVNAL